MFLVVHIKKVTIQVVVSLISLAFLASIFYSYFIKNRITGFIAGAELIDIEFEDKHEKETLNIVDDEKYFRPSKLPILNTKANADKWI